jgi:hypothetical protein
MEERILKSKISERMSYPPYDVAYDTEELFRLIYSKKTVLHPREMAVSKEQGRMF